jgi:predicted  nucleic acid-binding Zn-ribbon protein
MNPDLGNLIRLQAVESDLRKTDADLAAVPAQEAELDAGLAAERGRLDAIKAGLDGSQKGRRQREGELSDLESKRSKYKGQLMEVKTNKEYTAMLHEIEGVEREIRAREDLILAEMEKGESLAVDLKREEEVFKREEERHQLEVAALEARRRELAAQRERLAGERDRIAATVPEDLLHLFQRVAKLRGVAVAEAREGRCQECHLMLRPQMFVDLKRNEDIVQCPACNRILYYDTPVPVAAPQP